MKTVIRPETEMKDSGIEWVENIPKNWRLRKINSLFETIGSGTTPNSNIEEYYQGMVNWLQSGDINGTIVKSTKKHISNEIISSTSALTVYKAPFIVIAMYGASIGNISMVDIDACTNQACCALVKPIKDIDMQYAFWGLMAAKEELVLSSRGGGQPNISQNIIKQLRVPVPYLQEQQAIANYLDETCSKIDEIIAEAKASIDEYKELKQSVIFEAVTKGLDKNVNVYKTGNSWIPSLPVGIKLSRFGLHHDIILGKMLCPNPRNEEDTLEPYYCAANVHFDGVTGVLKTMWFNSKEKETYVVHKNDMLIVEGGAGAGGAAIMNEEPPVSTFVQNSIMIVRSHMKDNRYSCYLVQALVKNKYVDVVCNKATIPHFTKEKVSYMPYPVFNRNERNEIANYLDERCKQIDSLIAEKESLIHDLEAYKKSLIYEVVTGKRRVV